MTQQDAPKASLTARLDERFFAPVRNAAFARRTWFSVTLAGIVLVHAAVLGAFLWRDREDPVQQAKLEDTPIEVIVEPPKQQMPPAPQPPAPKPPAAKPMVEKPATARHVRPTRKRSTRSPTTRRRMRRRRRPRQPPCRRRRPKPRQSRRKSRRRRPPKGRGRGQTGCAEAADVVEKDAEALDKLITPEPPRRPAQLAQAKPVKPHQKTRCSSWLARPRCRTTRSPSRCATRQGDRRHRG